MKGINKAIIIGTLLRNPEIKNINDKFSYCEIIVVTRDEWDDRQSGQTKSTEHFITVKMMNKLSDIAMQYLHAGSKVYIEAKINGRKYQDKEGYERYALDIQAINMQMLDSKPVSSKPYDPTTSLTVDDLTDELPF